MMGSPPMPGLHQQAAAAAVQQLDQSGENDCSEAAGSSGGSGTGKEKARISGAGRSSSSSGRKKVSRPRFAFQTRSANDILDDGYRGRKYSAHPRFVVRFLDPSLNYYLVSHHSFSFEARGLMGRSTYLLSSLSRATLIDLWLQGAPARG